MIIGQDLSFSYGGASVLAGVDLASRPGRVLGMIGPNGSGKTTLLRLLYGSLNSPTGEVRIDDDRLSALSAKQTAARLAVVVQEAGSDTALSVGELVLLGRLPHLSTFSRPTPHDESIAAEALDRVGGTHLGHRSFGELSGGERQRVLIARALAQQATHLLLDEPTNHLDIRFQHELLQLVSELAHDGGTTTVIVLHDLNLAARYCDDLIVLGQDGVAAQGAVDDVLQPDVLEPVYGIGMQRLDIDGEIHLLFHPRLSRLEATR